MRTSFLIVVLAVLGCGGESRAPTASGTERVTAPAASSVPQAPASAPEAPSASASVPPASPPAPSEPPPAVDGKALCRDLRAIAVATTVLKDAAAKKVSLAALSRVAPFTSCRNPLEGTHAPKDHFGPAYACDLEGSTSSGAMFDALRTIVSDCFASEIAKSPIPDPMEKELGFQFEDRRGKKVTRRTCAFSKNERAKPPSLHWDCHVTMDESRSPN